MKRPVGCKAKTGVDYVRPLGAGTPKQEERDGQDDPTGGLEMQNVVEKAEHMRAMDGKPVVDDVGPRDSLLTA